MFVFVCIWMKFEKYETLQQWKIGAVVRERCSIESYLSFDLYEQKYKQKTYMYSKKFKKYFFHKTYLIQTVVLGLLLVLTTQDSY